MRGKSGTMVCLPSSSSSIKAWWLPRGKNGKNKTDVSQGCPENHRERERRREKVREGERGRERERERKLEKERGREWEREGVPMTTEAERSHRVLFTCRLEAQECRSYKIVWVWRPERWDSWWCRFQSEGRKSEKICSSSNREAGEKVAGSPSSPFPSLQALEDGMVSTHLRRAIYHFKC